MQLEVRSGLNEDQNMKRSRMDVSEAKRLKTLEDENARLKRLLAARWARPP